MLTKRKMLMGMLVLTFVACLAVTLWAQASAPPPGATGAAAPEPWTLWKTFKAGSYVGATIILISMAALALIINFFLTIRDEKLIPPDFVAALQEHIDQKRIQEAMALCETSDNYISRIMQVGLSEIPYGYDSMVDAMATVGEEESIKLNQKIGYLSFMGMIAPMLGLLGTVTGMVISFNVIANASGAPQASKLADGISQALVTTVEGLVTAIPCLFFHSLFQDKVTNIGLEAGAVCEELIRKFKPVRVQGVRVAAPAPKPAPVQAQGGAAPQGGAAQPTN